MKFFHIRYECNDARDDFSSQRRQAEKGGRTLFDMSSEEMDTQAYIFDGETYQENREHEILNNASWSNVSGGELLRQARMTQAENIMRSSGWLDKLHDNIRERFKQTAHSCTPTALSLASSYYRQEMLRSSKRKVKYHHNQIMKLML